MTSYRTVTGPVALIILDGWGIAEPSPDNAIALAHTPTFDGIWSASPHTTLSASGVDVGLRPGQFGNSEVGHLNIGAGFIVNQAIRQIDVSIEDGSFLSNPVLCAAAENAKSCDRPLHLIGLLSDGGVHSHLDHVIALLKLARRAGVRDVAVHAFLDGRDTSPTGGAGYLRQLDDAYQRIGVGRTASVIGRYFAMDRDHRWARICRAFELLVNGAGTAVDDLASTVETHYEQGTTDEFMEPLVAYEAPATVREGDSVIFFNFRADRARQITQALTGPSVDGDDIFAERPSNLQFVGFLPYAEYLDIQYAFEPIIVNEPLASVVAKAGLTQFHTAETEKYAHVTYFLNGGREEPFPGEDRKMIQSPDVPTYDAQPEMSAEGVGTCAAAAASSGNYDLIVINFANPDMVGHTGDLGAAVAACEAVDRELSRVLSAVEEAGGTALVIADHGNAEEMYVPGATEPMTAHTTNPVPCVLVGSSVAQGKLRDGGILADVAPTLLDVLGIDPPPTMTGTSLILDSDDSAD